MWTRRPLRLILGACALALLAAVPAACGDDSPAAAPASHAARATAAPTASPRPQLPRGGRRIFPRHRVVAFYGAAGGGALGVLGAGTPDEAARRLSRQARAYETPSRPVLPAFELIVTVAQASPGPDGDYSAPTPPATIRRYLAAARRARALLLLDVQPGRAPFLPEVRRYERFLRQPDVGLALDPEWSMRPGQVPAKTIGSTDARTINRVSAYLDGLVRRGRLPQKLLVVHQFTSAMVRDRGRVRPRAGLAITFHVDGFGSRAAKRSKYALLHGRPPFHSGFKLFYRQDVAMLHPAEVLRLRPAPDLVTYQ